MVDIEANIVKVGDREIPAQSFLSLAQYVIENISNNISPDEIKQNLISAGWEPTILDFMFETDKIFEKYYSKQPTQELTQEISSSSSDVPHESFSLEKLENMDQELKSTISNFTKFEGKLESESGKIDQFQDRLDVLKDSLSETRGMFMSSEKRMAEFEIKIEKAESIISDFDPKTLQERFALVDKKLDAFEGQLTKLEVQLQDSTKQVSQYIDFMKKIKSQESVLENLDMLRDKMKEFHNIKSDLDRKSGKIEVIFQELQDKNAKIESAYSKVDSFVDIIKDVMRDIDRISTKTATLTSKDDLNKSVSKINKEIEVIKNVIYDSKKKRSLFGFAKKEEGEEQPNIQVDGSQNLNQQGESQEIQNGITENLQTSDGQNDEFDGSAENDETMLSEIPPLEESELKSPEENVEMPIENLEPQIEDAQQSALEQVKQSLQEDQIKNTEEQEQLLQSSNTDDTENQDSVEDKISSFANAQKV